MATRKAKKQKRFGVSVYMQTLQIHKAGSAITLEIKADGRKLGEIDFGQGSFGWKPVSKQKFKRMNWAIFSTKLNEVFKVA